jgi:hypothetical protein
MARTSPDSHDASKGGPHGAEPRKPYETPRLIDYGPVSKLTQSGGITVQDHGTNKQVCL